MGLDQYAYRGKPDQYREYWAEGEFVDGKYVSSKPEPKELAYWRKHPNLQGWMERRWRQQNPDVQNINFNGVELELTWEDLDLLEQAVKKRQLPSTRGFFFGEDSDQHYAKQDLEFINEARTAILEGDRVFYNSSW